MNDILKGTDSLLIVAVIDCVIVFMAMLVDLSSGIHKAKQRGEMHSSYGLKRSIGKFIMYEGSMLIACGIDLLMHFCKLLQIVHLNKIYGIPVITCLIGIFLLVIEFISVMEKADNKTKTEISRVERLAAKAINKEEFAEALTTAFKNALKDKNNDTKAN